MKAKKPLAVLLAIITLVMSIITTFPITAMAAESKTATLKVGKQIVYNYMYTNDFTVNGTKAYCANPVKATPEPGTYQKIYNFTKRMPSVEGRSNPEYYRESADAVLWFGYGGPGFDKSMWPDKWYDGSTMTAAKYQSMTHVMLAFYYEGNSNRALAGTSTDFQTWVYRYIMGRKDGAWYDKYSDAPMYQIVHRRNEVPSGFKTFVLGTNAWAQDIASFEYNPGELKVTKVSANPDVTNGNPAYSLKGAKYTIYKKDGTKVATITCNNENGKFDSITLDEGDYYLLEARAPKGYKKDKTKIKFTMKSTDKEITVKDEPIVNQGQGIRKVSSNPDLTENNPNYSLAGAEYEIYDVATNSLKATITSDENGAFSKQNLDPGDYYMKEKTAPKGFKLSEKITYFTVETGKDLDIELVDEPLDDPIRIFLIKTDAETGKLIPQGSGQLAHAEFTVNYYASDYDSVDALNGVTPTATWILETDENGEIYLEDDYLVSGDAFYHSSNGEPTIPVGTVTIQETSAPSGYNLDSTVRLIKIDGSGSSTDAMFETQSVSDSVIRGGVKVDKYDIELGEGTPQGDAILSGARFQIENTSANPVVVNGVEYPNGEVVEIIETNEQGIAETAPDALPYGTYHIREITPPTGYLNTGIIDADFMITEEGQIVHITGSEAIQNDVIRGGVKLQKRDFETKEAKPQGAATLEGAVFEVINENVNPVLVEGTLYNVGEVVKTVTTGKDGSVTIANDVLPYGTYRVKEVQSSEGYLLEGILERTFQIRENGVIVDMTGVDDSIQNQVKRGDLEFVKIEDGTGNRMAGIPFRLTSKTTGESHVIVTDDNGYVSTNSDWISHFQNTNQGKTWEDGFWFGLESVIRDDKGALIYDTYILDELECEANKDKKRLEGIEVRISIDDYTVKMGTLTNDPITLQTTAVDQETGSHGANPVKDITILDTVKYTNLNIGDTYTLIGTIVDQATGKPILVDDKEITAEKKWTADRKDGALDMTFTFDASKLGNSAVVVFEELYRNGELVASHADLDDKGQTIVFNPSVKVGTTAIDTLTSNHIGIVRENGSIQDTVSFEGLVPWREYILKGYLVDQATGEILIADNKQVTAETVFTARDETGTAELTFTFDGSALKDGQAVVAFEELYWQDQLVGEHKDRNDADQTVTFKKVTLGTTATDELTGTNTGNARENAVILDTVNYRGLIPGQTYTIKGTLMSKVTGQPVTIDDKQITAEIMFLTDTENGTAALKYSFDATKLAEGEVVVFEELYYNGQKIGEHKDLYDANQTITYSPISIGTKAKNGLTGGNISYALKNETITDTVTYTGLTPKVEYVLKAILMDVDKKEPVEINGEQVTAEAKFTPDTADGKTDVVFADIDGTQLAGKKTVVFETLYRDGQAIAKHEDYKDKDQQMEFRKIDLKTTATDQKTGTHEITAAKSMAIVDEIEYDGLRADSKHTLKGVLMHKTTGEAVLVDGKEVTAEKTFTAKASTGSVNMTFQFDGRELEDGEIVVFEYLYENDVLIGSHEDLEDEAQTVMLINPGKITVDGSNGPGGSYINGSNGGVQTGDTGMKFLVPGIVLGSLALAAVGTVVVIMIRKKKTMKDQ